MPLVINSLGGKHIITHTDVLHGIIFIRNQVCWPNAWYKKRVTCSVFHIIILATCIYFIINDGTKITIHMADVHDTIHM